MNGKPSSLMDTFAQHFAHRLQECLDHLTLSQNQFALAIGVARSSVTGWLRHGKLPDAAIIAKICTVLGCSADWLLGLDSYIERKNDSGEIEWLEFIPPYLTGFQLEHVEQGIQLFNNLLNEQAVQSSIINDHNLRYLQFAVQVALRSGSIRLNRVMRDTNSEAQLQALYPFLKNVVVAKVPAKCDATIVRAEFVAFLAATTVLNTVIRENVVGLGTGYTLLRMCEQSVPSVDQFKGTQWLPLVTYTDDNTSGYTANQLAKLMQIRHPGSYGVYLPHPALGSQSEFEQATHLLQGVQTMFITVNGVGRRDRTLKTHPLTDFRTVDYAFDSAYLRDKYAELPDKTKFGGEVLGYLLNTQGEILDWDKGRVWALDLDVLRYNSDLVGKVVVVAARDYKAQAVETCLRGGLCNALVIDTEIADHLLHTS